MARNTLEKLIDVYIGFEIPSSTWIASRYYSLAEKLKHLRSQRRLDRKLVSYCGCFSAETNMKKTKREGLERAGYTITDMQKFLNLSDEEMAVIDLKISLVKKLKDVRKAAGVTQKQLAKLMKSSQSRVAMLESGSSDASLELICKALFVLGVSSKELGKTISSTKAA